MPDERVGKLSQSSSPGDPQPNAAEVESSRLLTNQAVHQLMQRGFSRERVQALVDEYVALDLGHDLDAFIKWASGRGPRD